MTGRRAPLGDGGDAEPIGERRRRLASLADGPPDAIERVRLLAELGWELRFAETDQAFAMAEEAFALGARSSVHTPARALAGRALAILRRSHSNLRGALEAAMAARDDYRSIGDRIGEAASHDALATVYEALGDYPQALDNASRALAIAREEGNLERQGWALSSIGGIRAASGATEAALQALHEALDCFERENVVFGRGRIHVRLVALYLKVGNLAAAKRHNDKRRELAFERGIPTPATLVVALGDVARAEGNLVEARAYYESALSELPATTDAAVASDVLVALGKLSLDEGNLDEARDRLVSAIARLEASGAQPLLAEAHLALSQVHERAGEHAAALGELKTWSALHEVLMSRESRAAVAREETRREIESAQKDAEIHRLKYVELEGMQARLVETERLAVLGHLAAGLAHELNTPLGVLASGLDVTRRVHDKLTAELGKEPGSEHWLRWLGIARETAATSDAAIQRALGFVGGMQRFARLDEAEWQMADVRECLAATLDLIEPTFAQRVTLTREIADMARTWASPARVNQALMTVVTHALEGLPAGGTIKVAARQDGDEIIVCISDDGPGLAREEVEKLFQVSWSRCGARVAMRMGLASVQEAMRAHGGSVEVESAPGSGTTIRLRIPVRDSS